MADQAFIAQIFKAWPDEAKARMDQVTYESGGNALTDSQLETIALALVGAHSSDLYELQQMREGHAVDTSQLPANYAQELQRVGATQADIVSAAQTLYPNLTRQQAVQRWMASASKIGYDIKDGAPAEAFYVPGASRPRESSD